MPYVFVVDERNFKECIKYGLFGVPNTARAYSQILQVKQGDKLFVYIYGTKRFIGVYEASSDPFTEMSPEKGPWIGRRWDERHGYYPHRIKFKIVKNYRSSVGVEEIEDLDIEINRNTFNGRSAVYITDYQREKLEEFLDKRNPGGGVKSVVEEFSVNPTVIDPFSLRGGLEARLQILIQRNMDKIEEGLQVVDTYYNLKSFLGYAGQIDILARDIRTNFVVIEIKGDDAPPEVWSQLFGYSHAIRSTLARKENVDVRSMLICKRLNLRTLYSYPEIKIIIKKPNMLQLFKYYLRPDFSSIDFKEVE